ncbi:membrane protein [Gordonia phage Moosehead]|nr:membrane protein [Gordonia phage Moosehead]
MEPFGRRLRPTPMLYDILAIIACLCGGYWLTTTPPTSH